MKFFLVLLLCIFGGIGLWQYTQQEGTSGTEEGSKEVSPQTVATKTQDVFSGSIEKAADVKNILEKKTGAVLDLSGQGLTKAPASIFEKTVTTELNLSNNKIGGALQAEVRLLSGLRVLNLSNNVFTGVPAEVGQLKNLEVLNLSNNKLTGLPQELGNLSKLKVLNVSGNAISQFDLDIIKKGLPKDVSVIE